MDDFIKGEDVLLSQLLIKEDGEQPTYLARAAGISKARVTAMLGSLEKEELIYRIKDAQDKRRLIIFLTDKGRERAIRSEAEVYRILENHLRYLGEKDAKEYVSLMKRIVSMPKE